MDLSKSKIVNLSANGTWEGNNGLFYRWEISLENGNVGDYSSSKYTTIESLPFTIGSEIEYEWHDGQYPKIKKPLIAGTERFKQGAMTFSKNGKGDDVQKMIVRQSSLQRAVEILIHNSKGKSIKPSDAIKYADYFTKWITGDEVKPETQKAPKPKPEPKQPVYEQDATYSDDLPF